MLIPVFTEDVRPGADGQGQEEPRLGGGFRHSTVLGIPRGARECEGHSGRTGLWSLAKGCWASAAGCFSLPASVGGAAAAAQAPCSADGAGGGGLGESGRGAQKGGGDGAQLMPAPGVWRMDS